MPGEEPLCAQTHGSHLYSKAAVYGTKRNRDPQIFDTDASHCKHLKVAVLRIFIFLRLSQFRKLIYGKLQLFCSQTRVTLKNHLGLQSALQWKKTFTFKLS